MFVILFFYVLNMAIASKKKKDAPKFFANGNEVSKEDFIKDAGPGVEEILTKVEEIKSIPKKKKVGVKKTSKKDQKKVKQKKTINPKESLKEQKPPLEIIVDGHKLSSEVQKKLDSIP